MIITSYETINCASNTTKLAVHTHTHTHIVKETMCSCCSLHVLEVECCQHRCRSRGGRGGMASPILEAYHTLFRLPHPTSAPVTNHCTWRSKIIGSLLVYHFSWKLYKKKVTFWSLKLIQTKLHLWPHPPFEPPQFLGGSYTTGQLLQLERDVVFCGSSFPLDLGPMSPVTCEVWHFANISLQLDCHFILPWSVVFQNSFPRDLGLNAHSKRSFLQH